MRTRPGPSLEEDEILAAMLGDTVDALDALMDPKSSPPPIVTSGRASSASSLQRRESASDAPSVPWVPRSGLLS